MTYGGKVCDMLYALDANVCIDLLRGHSQALQHRYRSMQPAQLAIPTLVYGELLLGAALSAKPSQNRRLVERLIDPLRLLDFDARAAEAYAVIRASTQKAGVPIGPNDLVIAATVLAHQAGLVTANVREFRCVPGLQVEDWTQPEPGGN